MKKIISLLFASTLLLSANECKLDKKILYSILLNESLPQKIGYPHIISFNEDSDAARAKKVYKKYFLNNRTIDCKNENTCKNILTNLTQHNIVNLDVGAFQINYKYHTMPIENYFRFSDSYKYACGFITELINEHGYNWKAIASYHSKTEKYNNRYRRKLMANYKAISSVMN